jgi:capsular polysaccharide biosynthesis protein
VTEQPLDLRGLAAAVWRQRRAALACIVVALVGAVGFTVVAPPLYTARALVLLPASSLDANGAPTRDVQTQVRIASSSNVLGLAARALHPIPNVADLHTHVTVSAPTPDLLQFAARASSQASAEATADQVANAYVVASQRGTSDLVTRVVAALKAQATGLTEQATALQTQIDAATTRLGALDPTSAAAANETARLDSLRAQQGDVASQLLNVNGQVSDVQLSSAVANSGTRLLQRASGASNAAVVTGLRNGGFGLVLGLLAGTMLALMLDRRDRRLRRRDDIARAAGVPTIASIATRVTRTSEERLALMSQYEPSLDESFGLRWTLRHLLTAHPATPARATIVLLAGDEAARGVPLQLAAFSARAGVRTVVLDAPTRAVAPLQEPARTDDGRDSVMPNLWLVASRANGPGIDHLSPQLVITVLVVAGGDLGRGDPDGMTTTLLAISSGFATSEAVGSVVAAATEGGRPLFGVIVANAEPHDDSSGRDPVAASTMRRRLPVRATRSAWGAR